MNLSTDRSQGVVIIRVGEAKLMYPMLSDFSAMVSGLVAEGESKVVIDMSQVSYVDSASIGCLMDLYRQSTKLEAPSSSRAFSIALTRCSRSRAPNNSSSCMPTKLQPSAVLEDEHAHHHNQLRD